MSEPLKRSRPLICFDLAIDWTTISTSYKRDMLSALINLARKKGILQNLIDSIVFYRPFKKDDFEIFTPSTEPHFRADEILLDLKEVILSSFTNSDFKNFVRKLRVNIKVADRNTASLSLIMLFHNNKMLDKLIVVFVKERPNSTVGTTTRSHGVLFKDKYAGQIAAYKPEAAKVKEAYTKIPTKLDEEDIEKLQALFVEKFSLNELFIVCFLIGVDYEDLSGRYKTDKIESLIDYCNREHVYRLLVITKFFKPAIDLRFFAVYSQVTRREAKLSKEQKMFFELQSSLTNYKFEMLVNVFDIDIDDIDTKMLSNRIIILLKHRKFQINKLKPGLAIVEYLSEFDGDEDKRQEILDDRKIKRPRKIETLSPELAITADILENLDKEEFESVLNLLEYDSSNVDQNYAVDILYIVKKMKKYSGVFRNFKNAILYIKPELLQNQKSDQFGNHLPSVSDISNLSVTAHTYLAISLKGRVYGEKIIQKFGGDVHRYDSQRRTLLEIIAYYKRRVGVGILLKE